MGAGRVEGRSAEAASRRATRSNAVRCGRRASVAALIAGMLVSGAPAVSLLASATALAQDSSVRTRLLDACVYDLYFEQRSSENVTNRCQCAVRKLTGTVSPEEAASYRVGSRLTGSLRQKVYGALNGC